MANRIVGLDIGTFAIKAVVIELQRNMEVVDYREVELAEFRDVDTTPGVDGTVAEPEGGDDSGELFPEVDPDDEPPGGDWEDTEDTAVFDEDDWSDAGIDGAAADQGPTEFGENIEVTRPWSMALAELKQEGFFEDVHQVITSFPDGKAVTLHLEVPFDRPRDIEDILPHLLMDELPISLGEVIYDFIVVPGKQAGLWEALVGFVEREEMAKFIGQCQQAGMEPAVVGVPELMLRYAGDQAVDPGVDSYGVIDIGHRFTRLLIMSQGRPVVVHTTRRGGAEVTRALAENFQISERDAMRLKHQEGVVGEAARAGDRRVRQVCGTIEEAMRPIVRDLRRTFQAAYANYDVAVDEIYICGGTSRLHGLEDFLQREFEVPVEPLRCDQAVIWSVDAQTRERVPEAAMALGNALQRPLDESDRNLIDFRQQEFVFRGKSSYLHTQLVRYGVVAALLLVMLAGVLIMQYYDQRTQRAVMQAAVAEQTEELFGESLTTIQQVQTRLEGEVAADRGFIPRMSAYELMFQILDQIDEDIKLELDRIEVDTDRSLVQLLGETDSPQSVDVLANQIEDLECLRNVRKDQVNVRGEDEVQFELQISSGCS